MALRVAELEVLFTADTSNFDVGAKRVETTIKAIDKGKTEATITADTSAAEKSTKSVQDGLDKVAHTKVEARIDLDMRGVERGTRRAEDSLGEFKDEANSTAKEAAASFDGSADSIADAFQEVAANAFVGFGPAGAAAGLAVALGLGTAIAKTQELAEENNELRETIVGNAQAIADGTYDARQAFIDWTAEIREDNAWTFWTDEARSNLQLLAEAVAAAGGELGELAEPLVNGDLDAATTTLANLRSEVDRLTAAYVAGNRVDVIDRDAQDALRARIVAPKTW
jgi:hypothetical protein